jgi:hypothetical protein
MAAGVLTPAAQARPAAPAPHVLAPVTSSVRDTVCGLVKYPLKTAARKLIGLIADKDIAVLSASLLRRSPPNGASAPLPCGRSSTRPCGSARRSGRESGRSPSTSTPPLDT